MLIVAKEWVIGWFKNLRVCMFVDMSAIVGVALATKTHIKFIAAGEFLNNS